MDRKKVTIVTHNGAFHSDDVFAVATLLLMLKDSADVNIVRTRDRSIIDTADYAVDVGDTYDSDKNRFDHHQKGRAGVRDNGIPYASFGLVWKKYGEMVCGDKIIARKIEEFLVMPIDARDNGVDIMTPTIPGVAPFEIRNILYAFRTTWKEDSALLYDNFIFLVDFAKKIIQREIIHMQDEAEARDNVLRIYAETKNKKIIILDRHYPFDDLGKDMPETLIVVYPDISDGNWCLECIRSDFHSYESRIKFPENWAGKMYAELEEATGVSGSIFCHTARFFTVARTKEAALKLAEIALYS